MLLFDRRAVYLIKLCNDGRPRKVLFDVAASALTEFVAVLPKQTSESCCESLGRAFDRQTAAAGVDVFMASDTGRHKNRRPVSHRFHNGNAEVFVIRRQQVEPRTLKRLRLEFSPEKAGEDDIPIETLGANEIAGI